MILLKTEIEKRINKFYELMNKNCPDWDIAVMFDRVNQYYFTGTMQNSVLVFLRNGTTYYFVKKSYKRAKVESGFENIYPMSSFRDIIKIIGDNKYINGYTETSKVPIALFNMINKYLNIQNVKSLDGVIGYQRSIKSPYELEIMKEVGRRHYRFTIDIIPKLLKEGMSELEFAALCGYEMIKYGHQGLLQHNMFQPNASSGEIAFGENSVYPTAFDGPGGSKGMYPAQARMGNPDRILKPGDLVFVDWSFAMYGYHTDKTQIFMFKGKVCDELMAAQRECIKIEKLAADMMKTGELPSNIYNSALGSLSDGYKDNFMGANGENVKFLGHGIGLCLDEQPVISAKNNIPLEENMTIAVEPKISFKGIGVAGVEETYIVTKNGGVSITGEPCEIIEVN